MSGRRTVEAANQRNAFENYLMGTVLMLFAIGAAWMANRHLTFRRNEMSPALLPAAALAFFAILYCGNAALNTLRVRKPGKSVLESEEVFYGSGLRGLIRTERVLDTTGDYKLQLKCIERLMPRTTNMIIGKRRAHEIVQWQTEHIVPATSVHSTTGIPVEIPIPHFPFEGHASGMESVAVRWQLEIRAPLRGFNYYAIFDVQAPRTDQRGS